jgi:hypothetical protein
MKLNNEQRKKISDLSSGLAQILFGSMVIGQLFPAMTGRLHFWVKIGAIVFSLASCTYSVIIIKGIKEED